ncbi:GNAT family N-acetyltransferase [Alkalicella caledoniensis]|uniref:GNAT family N-acetyltransferase n=1 Tax=Alkalicella caledoniensis TaxID=2731377 RepID=A0A7G9W6E0_ALKCA|nr:GNAT family N-acetyltransferase [Alkalicella caledoniensis]QNO14252.1 GNAT family N-acetyltransferase [Alkalicella caledoniensis]
MEIRSIVTDEIDKFSGINSTGEKQIKFKEFLEGWFQEGKTKPEWCFVVEKGETFIGRIIFWAFPDQPNHFKIAGLKLPHDDEEVFYEIAKKLITEGCRKVSGDKTTEFEYHLYSKNNDYFNNYNKLLQECEFISSQEKSSFLNEGSIEKERYSDITFRSLNVVGEKEFVKAIELVSINTLDTEDQLSIETLGSEAAALEYYNILKSIDLNGHWWQLAYDRNEDLVGLVVPQKLDETHGAINYIGVVPNKRGNDYVSVLLIKGTNILKENGLTKVIADIDNRNFPLEQALYKVGFKLDSQMINYKK